MNVSELASELGISKDTLRSYITNGSPKDWEFGRDQRGWYNFTGDDLDILYQIHYLRKSGVIYDEIVGGWDVSE